MAKKSTGKAVKKKTKKTGIENVEAIVHDATRINIPTAEYQAMVQDEARRPVRVEYERRNRDLDPQLVWRGKDEQDWSDLVVHAPPLYIQEKVHPKVLIDDLLRQSRERQQPGPEKALDLFADFNGIPEGADRTEFYQHDQNWTNRMILGDSLQVMASLAEREGLRGKVQCIYIDPPYGIKFNSNFQWSTTSRDVKDGNAAHITREPEQVKAFRDTWRDGIHSYLTYLRDRLVVARDLLTESGSVFVQIGDENMHRVRALLDEIFGADNHVSDIVVVKSSGLGANTLPRQNDYILFYAKDAAALKYRQIFRPKAIDGEGAGAYQSARGPDGLIRRLSADELSDPTTIPTDDDPLRFGDLTKPGPGAKYPIIIQGTEYTSRNRWWGMPKEGLERADRAGRLYASGNSISYVRLLNDWSAFPLTNIWTDTGTGSGLNKVYVVQTDEKIVQRCLIMTTDPGDLVLDPTCGSGTTAYVAEQWGRRWITIDTSRVALALARARIMGARYPYYLLKDSPEGRLKEADVTRMPLSSQPTRGSIRQGFVYERVPHITLKSIANNAEIDVIWEKWQTELEPLRGQLNAALKTGWQEWEIPREADAKWPDNVKKLHAAWWGARIARQKELDASIAAKADHEFLYDRPYTDNRKVRVAGPFTVESMSPHRVLGVDENDELIDHVAEKGASYAPEQTFEQIILENLRTAGVQQAHKEDRIAFTSLTPWPGDLVCGEGRYDEAGSGEEKRAAIFIGPEFGTVTRPDLVEAAREAAEADFDVLIACAFNYEAHATEFNKLGRVPVLKARMNADLHMAEDLKNTGKGNLFVIFGEPDIEVLQDEGDKLRVKVNGVDVFDPGTGEVRSDGPDGIACWFLDTDYNGESFFVRHAYFLGASDPYKALKTTLKAEIDEDAWASLNSDASRPFRRPDHGRIAVKVINHLGDEVMKVFRVDAGG
jgi:adenine-specific DNA-methyltransferase